eukprot:CCRYP_005464-RA/>CCRYP_005464-RA protein AED:0.15 eAED:0.23 QI:0/0/0/1/0/0/5/0/569
MEFEIYTDASSKQLGSVITQGNRPLAFFSRKLSTTQQKYSVTELELLAIVETLKEFKGMLWGQRLKVYTDHKNLIQDALGLTSDRVYRWRLLLEEFGPEIVYIKGIHNTVADAISRLDIGPMPSEHENWMTFTKCWCHYTMQEESAIDTSAYQEEMNLVFANRSEEDYEIAEAQKLDASLKTLKDQYLTQLVESTHLLCKEGKMVIPKDLQHRAVSWYHHYLQHPGHTRLEETLRAAMYWKGMRNTVRKYVKNCHACQVNKRHKHKYGKLPTKFAITNPWDVLCVDLIGPYTIKVCGPFDDADLASHILRMVPRNWQDQYELSGALVPQSVRELLKVLERIEKACPTEKDALRLTSDRVYQWRLLLKEFGPEIVYIKGIHNTVADAISRLDIGPISSEHESWMTFTKCWCHYTMQEESAIDTSAYQEEMNLVFANHSKEDVIYPLTVREIAEAQKIDASLKTLKDQYLTQLVESTHLLCKDGKMLVGSTTIYSTLDTRDSKKPFVLQCTGKVCEIPSVNMSKTVMHAKSTRGISISMGNSLLNSPSQTLGMYYVWTLLARIQSQVKMGQ